MKSQIAFFLLIAIAFTVKSSLFTVKEGRQAFITEFGKIKGDPITEAGLHFKLPFIQDVRSFDKRILQWDGDAEQIPTKDKKYIIVDTTARWRIKDVIRFAQTVQNEKTAANRLDGILDGITRDTISSYNLVETVRNSNLIIEQIADKKQSSHSRSQSLPQSNPSSPQTDSDDSTLQSSDSDISQSDQNTLTDLSSEQMIGDDDIIGEVETITVGREELTKQIISNARTALEDIGIELLDVQLRRVFYEESVEKKVYERMITERQKIASRIRSFGKGEAAKISGRLNLRLKEIESEAYKSAQTIIGDAEAISIKTYADALSKDPKFYEFQETLSSYRQTLKDQTSFILSSDARYLKTLQGP